MKNINSKKRGISSIIGTLMMVAVVAVIGSVIMFQAMNGINNFNYYLSFLTGKANNAYESAVIEHVRFYPNNSTMDIWVRNTGSVELNVAKLTMVNIQGQTLLINNPNYHTPIPLNQLVNLKQSTVPITGNWATGSNPTSDYRISVTTSAGTSFETTARPYNS